MNSTMPETRVQVMTFPVGPCHEVPGHIPQLS